MTLAIIAFTAVVSLIALNNRAVFENLLFYPFGMQLQRDWFRFITHGFVHGGFLHLAINMYVLWMFGTAVEGAYADITGRSSTLPFLVLYLGGIVLSSIPGYFKHKDDPGYRAVGASGATSAVVLSYILLFPDNRLILLIWPDPDGVPAWSVGVLFLASEWYMSKRGRDGIAHDAHYFGALYGIAFTALLDPKAVARFIQAVGIA